MSNRVKITSLAIALVVVLATGSVGTVLDVGHGHHQSSTTASTGAGLVTAADTTKKPNVIFFLADDADKKLMQYMPYTRRLIGGRGAVFPHYYVEQSTCCTSRATMLTGMYTHNHGVRGNHYPAGGFFAFRDKAENLALPTWLQAAGVRTSLMGKYLNEYPYPAKLPFTFAQKKAMRSYVPPGWNNWQSPVTGDPYQQFDYGLNTNGVVGPRLPGYEDTEYQHRLLSEIHGADGMDFKAGGQFVYYASYSPHEPFGHPKYLDKDYKHVKYPHAPDFNEKDVSDKFGIARLRKRLTAKKIAAINVSFRNRIRSVQVLDHTVKKTVQALRKQGTLDNTYLIFTSDNGYNMGEHRLAIAKYNQFQETVNVPLYVAGPGIAPHTVLPQLSGNVDIAPTIAAMTGTPIPDRVDGLSLLPLLHREKKKTGRNFLLISRGLIPLEKKAESSTGEYPETTVESPRHARISDFNGVVTERWKYVKYTNSIHAELYDLKNDPYELHNLLPHDAASIRAMSPAMQATLYRLKVALAKLLVCAASSCRF